MKNYDKIVVADDEDMCREVAVRICRLVAPKIKVYEVSNGRDLVEKVRQNNCAFILTDNDMPLMSGLEAVVEIRRFNPYVPICLISGGSLTEEEVYKAGANHFLCKPYEVFELTNIIKKYCNRKPC